MKTKISARMLCQVAALIAVAVVLERFCSISTPIVRLGFTFIPMALCGMLFGPVWGGIAYGLADIIGVPFSPYGFFPGIMISRIMSGVIFGLYLHRERIRFFPHALGAALTEQIVCSLGITTLALALAGGTQFFPMMATRIPQAAIVTAMQLIVIPLLPRLRDALRKTGLRAA